MIQLTYDKSNPIRLDHFLTDAVPQLSRSYIRRLHEQQHITVNGEYPTKPGTLLKQGDDVVLDIDLEKLLQIPPISLPILYEDDDCIVIDKPAGILTHSKGAFNPEATVATFIQGKVQQLSGDRAGIVHRLDRVTSGLIICAKNPAALSWLQKQFSQRKTKKTYVAIVNGTPDPKEAIIDMPIERDPKKPKAFHAVLSGKPAQTHYRVLQEGQNYSLLELMPTTGRTHQLRVHLSHLKHPILGDELYGSKPAERVFLHAHKLELTLPSRQRKVFVSPVPHSFTEVMSDGPTA